MLAPSIFNCNKVTPFGFEDLLTPSPFETFFGEFPDIDKTLYGKHAGKLMATDVRETEENYEVDVNVPGFRKEDITITLKDGYLSVATQKRVNKDEEKKGKLIRQERYTGSMSRSFYVGENITEEDIKAKFEHGVLKLTIPKKEEKVEDKAHTIEIEG